MTNKCNFCSNIFVRFHMLDVCRPYAVCTGCMRCLHHLNYYWTFLKLSVNLNLHVARLLTPDSGGSSEITVFFSPSLCFEHIVPWFFLIISMFSWRQISKICLNNQGVKEFHMMPCCSSATSPVPGDLHRPSIFE